MTLMIEIVLKMILLEIVLNKESVQMQKNLARETQHCETY